MREFIDREIAIKSMNKILTEHTTPWIVLSGDSRIGKTEFAKKYHLCMKILSFVLQG